MQLAYRPRTSFLGQLNRPIRVIFPCSVTSHEPLCWRYILFDSCDSLLSIVLYNTVKLITFRSFCLLKIVPGALLVLTFLYSVHSDIRCLNTIVAVEHTLVHHLANFETWKLHFHLNAEFNVVLSPYRGIFLPFPLSSFHSTWSCS